VLRSRGPHHFDGFEAGAAMPCGSGPKLYVQQIWIVKNVINGASFLLFPYTLNHSRSNETISPNLMLSCVCFTEVDLVYDMVGLGSGAALKFLLGAGAEAKKSDWAPQH
jgi:hypothetical protein